LRKRRARRSGKNVLGSGAFFKNAPVGVQRAKPSDRQALCRRTPFSFFYLLFNLGEGGLRQRWTRAKAQKGNTNP